MSVDNIKGSGALPDKIFIVINIENNKIEADFRSG